MDPDEGLSALLEKPTAIMGIINVTPDSFSDGGVVSDASDAVAVAERMLDEGADIIDVGGESSRPGAASISVDEELERVMPVVERLAGTCLLSIDTAKAEVAAEALGAGVHILNDITASLEQVAAAFSAGWIAMHMSGRPTTMQDQPSYGDVVDDVASFLDDAYRRGSAAGVESVWVDPGIGFGKTRSHNLELLRNLDAFTSLGARLAIGVSRKSFIGRMHAESDGVDDVAVSDRLEGSLYSAAWSWSKGAHIVRVHDVAASAKVAKLIRHIE